MVKLSSDYSKLKADFQHNQERDEEERKSNSAKFHELYNSRNDMNGILVELSTTLKILANNINNQFEKLDKKINDMKRGGK